MPWLLTRTLPSEVDPVFTVTAAALVLCAAGFAAALVVVVLELLEPHAAKRRDTAARDGTVNLARNRICSLPIWW